MKTNVSVYDFREAFTLSDTYKHNFSYDALTVLYEYLEQYEEDIGEEISFDMIALCCEYSEYKSAIECVESYNPEYVKNVLSEEEDAEEREKLAREWLGERTTVIPFCGGIIISQF